MCTKTSKVFIANFANFATSKVASDATWFAVFFAKRERLCQGWMNRNTFPFTQSLLLEYHNSSKIGVDLLRSLKSAKNQVFQLFNSCTNKNIMSVVGFLVSIQMLKNSLTTHFVCTKTSYVVSHLVKMKTKPMHIKWYHAESWKIHSWGSKFITHPLHVSSKSLRRHIF